MKRSEMKKILTEVIDACALDPNINLGGCVESVLRTIEGVGMLPPTWSEQYPGEIWGEEGLLYKHNNTWEDEE